MSDYRVRDSVHGFIHVSEGEKRVIDSREFQRLRNIRQLAMTSYVYPGAVHSRFEHSLGTMELASRMFDRLLGFEDGTRLKEALDGFPVDEAKQILRLTALLHDVGHLPFSHGGEAILPAGKKHEHVSAAVILHSDLKDLLAKEFGEQMPERVAQLIDPDGSPMPNLLFLKEIISGEIDADRTDYLIRDSLHCGVKYGSFDYSRLLESIALVPGESGSPRITVDLGGVYVVESLVLARYFMFTQVYFHRTRRIYDLYLTQYLRERKPEWEGKDLIAYAASDDVDLMSNLRRDVAGEFKSEWAERLVLRKHHSQVFATSDHARADEVRNVPALLDRLKKEFGETDAFIVDEAQGNLHKFYRARLDETDGWIDLPIYRRSLRTVPLLRESTVLWNMPHTFKVVRIYADGNCLDTHKVRQSADKHWRELIG